MDVVLFNVANHLVSYSWWTFFQALESAELSWLVASAALVAMWFAGKTNTQSGYIQHLGKESKDQTIIRGHILLLSVAMSASFVLARALQHFFPRQRPMAVTQMEIPIDPTEWHMIKKAISAQGSFPSDHAVMWFVMATGIFWLNRPAGIFAALLGILLSVLRIGTGFHWASDIAAGALLGITMTVGAFWSLRTVKPLKSLVYFIVGLFERHPIIMNTLGFLILLDFSRKFAGLFGFLATVLGKSISH